MMTPRPPFEHDATHLRAEAIFADRCIAVHKKCGNPDIKICTASQWNTENPLRRAPAWAMYVARSPEMGPYLMCMEHGGSLCGLSWELESVESGAERLAVVVNRLDSLLPRVRLVDVGIDENEDGPPPEAPAASPGVVPEDQWQPA
jgi:hypothetical protein